MLGPAFPVDFWCPLQYLKSTCKVQLNLVYVPRHQILEILEPQDILVINVLNIPEKFIFKRTIAWDYFFAHSILSIKRDLGSKIFFVLVEN